MSRIYNADAHILSLCESDRALGKRVKSEPPRMSFRSGPRRNLPHARALITSPSSLASPRDLAVRGARLLEFPLATPLSAARRRAGRVNSRIANRGGIREG